jgi:hypothetical protein
MGYDITLLYPPAQQYRRRTSQRKRKCASRRQQGQQPESPTTPIPAIAGVEELWKQEAKEWAESVRRFQMRIEEEEERAERDMQREKEDKERQQSEARMRAIGAEGGWDRCRNKLLDIYGATDNFPAYGKLLGLFIVTLHRSRRIAPRRHVAATALCAKC